MKSVLVAICSTIGLALVVSCIPAAQTAGQPVKIDAPRVDVPQHTNPPAAARRPCDSPAERTWIAYEEAEDELRWYEFVDSVTFFTGDAVTKKFKTWPQGLADRKSAQYAEVLTNALMLRNVLENNKPPEAVPSETLLWEANRDRIRGDRLTFVDDLFRLVYNTKPSNHMLDKLPLVRPH